MSYINYKKRQFVQLREKSVVLFMQCFGKKEEVEFEIKLFFGECRR